MRKAAYALLGSMVVVAVATAIFDLVRANRIARGIEVAGVQVGGLSASSARQRLADRLSRALERPVTVRAGHRRFTLPAHRSSVRVNPRAMVEAAIDRSRGGNPLSRAFRDLRGKPVRARLPARVHYSEAAVRALARRVKRSVDRRPRSARIRPSGAGVGLIEARTGLRVDTSELMRRTADALGRRGAGRRVKAPIEVTQPRRTTAELRRRYSRFLTVDRQGFRLRLYRGLRLERRYTIAVGRVGFETPAGLYRIQNKGINPTWQVPNRAWAGDKAGRAIPPGPENPLKARWMGLYDGAGIHGTDEVGSLGSRASRGCIRMSIPEVIELYRQVPLKTPVYIG